MNEERIRGLGGGAIWASLITGVAGLIGASFGAGQFNWSAVGICLIASAIAFTGIANVIFRR